MATERGTVKKRKPERCAALDPMEARCPRTDTVSQSYHGDAEIYAEGSGPRLGPSWVRVYLCSKHRDQCDRPKR